VEWLGLFLVETMLAQSMRATTPRYTSYLTADPARSRSCRDDVSRQLVTLLNIKDAIGSIPAKCRHQTL